VDLDFGVVGDPVFPAAGFEQHLSVHDGLISVEGSGVSARLLAWHDQDVMAIEVDDQRREANPLRVSLRMLRYLAQHSRGLEEMIANNIVQVQTFNHVAASQLSIHDGKIVLTQEFREGEHYNKSAVAIGFAGRAGTPRIVNETEVELTAVKGSGAFTCLIASAASFDPKEDVAASALRQLDAAAAKGWSGLARENKNWWNEFWSRGLLHLHSADGEADYVEQNYNYFMYLMASTSRGSLPTKFNGMLWNTGGDLRAWGSQHWFANLSCIYECLSSTNRWELLDPVFDMYSGMYDACALAARQQWGSQGIYIPETVYFNGLAKLPDDIAQEMQDLYLVRKPWEERSAKFMQYASTKHPHSSRWNWISGGKWVEGKWVFEEKGAGPFSSVNHIFGTTAKVAYLYWRRYEYTLDQQWLRARAYPMIKGAAEFYRNYPKFRKGADGKWHIHDVNSNESVWGGQDSDEDISAMMGIFAAAIRASEILNLDAGARAAWSEIIQNLTPLNKTDDADSLKPDNYTGPSVWVRARRPVKQGRGGLRPDGNSTPQWFFDLCGLETGDKERLRIANNTFDAYFREGISADTPVGVLSKVAIAGTILGREDAVRHLIPNQMRVMRRERGTAYQGGGELANRMTLREGAQGLDAQRLGRAAEALHQALLQSYGPAPAGDPVLRVFAAWPKDWDASFTLAGRGGFLVTSSMRGGKIEFVEIKSQAGASCKLRNPWAAEEVTLFRDGQKAETLSGDLLKFATRKGERVIAVRTGTAPADFQRTVMA
jgi:hypothetical protein